VKGRARGLVALLFSAGCALAAGSCDNREVVQEGQPCPPPYGPQYCGQGTYCAAFLPAPGDCDTNTRYSCLPLMPGCVATDLCHCGTLLPDGGRALSCTSCTQSNGIVTCSQ